MSCRVVSGLVIGIEIVHLAGILVIYRTEKLLIQAGSQIEVRAGSPPGGGGAIAAEVGPVQAYCFDKMKRRPKRQRWAVIELHVIQLRNSITNYKCNL